MMEPTRCAVCGKVIPDSWPRLLIRKEGSPIRDWGHVCLQHEGSEEIKRLAKALKMAEAVKSSGMTIEEFAESSKRSAEYFKWKPGKEAEK